LNVNPLNRVWPKKGSGGPWSLAARVHPPSWAFQHGFEMGRAVEEAILLPKGFAILIEPDLCIGCSICELICSISHRGAFNPKRGLLAVRKDVFSGDVSILICRNCPSPPCYEACGIEGAMSMEAGGVLRINPSKCTGCKACMSACPHGAIFYDDERGICTKCDLCGGEALCAKWCPQGAIKVMRA
jgi:carbon-monoxide dehydrogenase iron sulfur subunit